MSAFCTAHLFRSPINTTYPRPLFGNAKMFSSASGCCHPEHALLLVFNFKFSIFNLLGFNIIGVTFARALGSAHLSVEPITIPHSVNHTGQNTPQGWRRLDRFSASLRKQVSGLGKLTWFMCPSSRFFTLLVRMCSIDANVWDGRGVWGGGVK